MKYLITSEKNQIDFKSWDEFVHQHPDGTVFQSSEIFHLFDHTRKFEPIPILVTNNKNIQGVLLAVIIKEYAGKLGFFTSRTVIYGGPLINASEEEFDHILNVLLKELMQVYKTLKPLNR